VLSLNIVHPPLWANVLLLLSANFIQTKAFKLNDKTQHPDFDFIEVKANAGEMFTVCWV
jgi:hypothetical protein